MNPSPDERSQNLKPTPQSQSDTSFVFISGGAEGAKPMTAPASTFTLANARVGDRLLVVAINCGVSNRRLAQQGLSIGKEVIVLSHTSGGSVVIQASPQNIGLSAALAQHIYVGLNHN